MMNRRQVLSRTLLGTVGGLYALEKFSSLGWVDKMLLPSLGGQAGSGGIASAAQGTLEILQAALRGGPGLLRAEHAFAAAGVSADPTKQWSVVTIKVVNHVHTPLVFKLGRFDEGTQSVVAGAEVGVTSDKMGNAKDFMQRKGVDQISNLPRYRRLRFNKWFADMLHTGKSDVQSSTGAAVLDTGLLFPSGGAEFPANVAIQAGLHLVPEYITKNHSLLNFRVRPTEGDLAHFVEKYGIVNSPLGVTTFMMGDKYDKAEGSFDRNAVLGDSNGIETPVAQGGTVKQIVDALEQSVAGGYADIAPFDQNVTVKFDRLVDRDPKLRRALFDSKDAFKATLTDLRRFATLESTGQVGVGAASGSLQSGGTGAASPTPASHEFLAQCAYTARALQIEGRPVRNFSLFLNTSDLDGKNLDEAFFGGGAEGIKCYTTIEGMRQLALGLNILSKVISEKRNVLVVVVSEGGRDKNLGDNHVSFGLVLGPSGPGMLADHLHAHTGLINEESNAVVSAPGAIVDTNNSTTWVRWNTDTLVTDAGVSMNGKKATTSGDWQLGVAEFLAEKMGVTGALNGQMQFVKLKRG
jgi:hypothetical protein